MKTVSAVPIKTAHSNAMLRGFDDVVDLHVTRVQYSDGREATVSVWKVGFWSRLKFIFDGRINFICMADTHPPIAIAIGDLGQDLK